MAGRKDTRIVINREFGSIEEFIYEYVMNISRTGAFIRSRDPLPVGTKVRLEFTVVSEELQTIKGMGEVVRVVAPGGEQAPGMGVVFTRLTSVSRKFLESLLARKGPPPHPKKTAPRGG